MPKGSSDHEYVLEATDYFTKWVEAASYAKVTSKHMAKFIINHIICRYGVPHELMSDQGSHFRKDLASLPPFMVNYKDILKKDKNSQHYMVKPGHTEALQNHITFLNLLDNIISIFFIISKIFFFYVL